MKATKFLRKINQTRATSKIRQSNVTLRGFIHVSRSCFYIKKTLGKTRFYWFFVLYPTNLNFLKTGLLVKFIKIKFLFLAKLSESWVGTWEHFLQWYKLICAYRGLKLTMLNIHFLFLSLSSQQLSLALSGLHVGCMRQGSQSIHVTRLLRQTHASSRNASRNVPRNLLVWEIAETVFVIAHTTVRILQCNSFSFYFWPLLFWVCARD